MREVIEMKRFVKSLFCLLFVAALSISLASCVFEYVPVEPDTPTDPDTPVEPDEPKPSIKDDYDCITIAEAIELAIAAGASRLDFANTAETSSRSRRVLMAVVFRLRGIWEATNCQ